MTVYLCTLFCFIAVVPAAHGQGDVFNTNSTSGAACAQPLARESERHEQALRDIQRQGRINSDVYQRERALCSPGDQPCMAEADRAHVERSRQNELTARDEDTRHRNAVTDIESGPLCMPDRISGGTSCDVAKASEDRRHNDALAGFRKTGEENTRVYVRARAGCPMGDIQCYDRVDREHVERSKQNDIAAQQEETRHATALEQIRANCAAAVRRGSNSQGGSGSVPDRRRQSQLPGLSGELSKTSENSPNGQIPTSPNEKKESNSAGEYALGLAEGLGDCIHGFIDTGIAAVLLFQATQNPVIGLQTNWVDVAKSLGLEPGQSVVLRTIWQELVQTKVIGRDISARARGKIDGSRLCAYAGPALSHVAEPHLSKLKTPGATPVNPLAGASLSKAMSQIESDLAAHSGKWIATPKGPLKLGGFVGKGSFSTVYELAGKPNQVIKIGNSTGESSGSFSRQITGSARLTQAGVDTPPIHYVDVGTPYRPGVLITDNINARGPPGSVLKLSATEIGRNPAAMNAMQDLFRKVGDAGYAFADGHPGNVRFSSAGPGALKAIVIDPDFVMTPQEFAASIQRDTAPGRVLAGKLMFTEELLDWSELQQGRMVSASKLSKSLFDAFKQRVNGPNNGGLTGVGRGSTVPRQ